MSLQVIVLLFGSYALLTLLAPRILGRPQLMNTRPALVLWLWLGFGLLAGVSLVTALAGLATRAWQQHIQETFSARIIGPIAEYVMGWLAIAALGVLAFRIIAAVGELRGARREILETWQLISPGARTQTLHGHPVMIVDSAENILMAIPQENLIVASTHLVDTLTDAQLAAGLCHEQAHLDGHHGLIRELGILAIAIAPGFSASTRMAQATRIATELIADDVAAAQCGAGPLADSLQAISQGSSNSLMTERITRLRA